MQSCPSRFLVPVVLLVTASQAQAPIDPAGVKGTRILAGGGKLPAAILSRFVELAGGSAADIVLIPTATARADRDDYRQSLLERWQTDHPDAGFTVLHTRSRQQADTEEFTAPLRSATGAWFGGGQQQRLAAAYVGTRVERELLVLLARGGTVAGSSAGAAV